MATVSLLKTTRSPTEQQVRAGLEGNLCRCTGYHNIVRRCSPPPDGVTS